MTFCTPRLPLALSLFGQRQSLDDVSFASLSLPSWGETCFLAGVIVQKLPEAQPWWWTHHALGVQLPMAGGHWRAVTTSGVNVTHLQVNGIVLVMIELICS